MINNCVEFGQIKDNCSKTFVFIVIMAIFNTKICRADTTIPETTNDINNVLDKTLRYIVTTFPKPFSVSIVLPKENTCAVIKNSKGFEFAWKLFSTEYPVISGQISKEIRKSDHTLDSFINIIFLDDCSMASTIENLKSTTNRRKDYFVFLASQKTLDIVFEKYETVRQLRNKIGIILETKEILREPFVYTGKMIKFGNPNDFISYSETLSHTYTLGGNLRGRYIRSTGSILPPWACMVNGKVDGSHYRIVEAAYQRFNFTVEFQVRMVGSYAEKLPNGTWGGMISDIIYQDRNFDMTIYLGQAIDWFHLLDFVGPLGFAKLNYYVANPRTDIKWEALFYPYQPSTWMGILGSQIFVTGVLICFTFVAPQFMGRNKSIFPAIFIPFALTVEQSYHIPRGFRFISFLWMMFIIVIGTGYKSNLVSYLSFPQTDVIPRTYVDLSKMPHYSGLLNNIGIVEVAFIKTSTSPIIEKIRKKLKFDPDTSRCLIKSFLDRRTACMLWYPYSRYVVAKSLTLSLRLEPLVTSSDAAIPVSMSVAFVKDSIYVDAFAPIAAILFDTGHVDKWEEDIIYIAKKEGREEVSKNKNSPVYKELQNLASTLNVKAVKPLKMKNLFIVFVFLIIATIVSFLVALMEIVVHNVMKFWERRNSKVTLMSEKVLQVKISPEI